jgi:hypothetical protein
MESYLVPGDRIELPTRGFSVGFLRFRKATHFQQFYSVSVFVPFFGFVWNRLEKSDLDGHILGTVGAGVFGP